jgi:hypothetical protein
VEFDGVFHHGLDRHIDEIRNSERAVDRRIFKKWNHDRQKDEWFRMNHLTLIRITDKTFRDFMEAQKK